MSKTTFLKRLSVNRHKIIFAAIFGIAVVHFAVQFSFIQSEKLRSVESAVQIENIENLDFEDLAVGTKPSESQFTGIKTEEFEARKVKPVAISERVQPVLRRQIEIVQPQTKKKIVRETREARIRRAERILTGV